jgi:uridine kinase
MDLISALLDLCSTSERPIIAIDGPAGAGKTTLSQVIKLALANRYEVNLLHMDNLYDGWDGALSPQLSQTLTYIVKSHRAGANLNLSYYDWTLAHFQEAQEIVAKELLILEGVGSGQSAIRSHINALIWIGVDEKVGLERVLERDGDYISSHMERWLTTQAQHFLLEKTEEGADFSLTT